MLHPDSAQPLKVAVSIGAVWNGHGALLSILHHPSPRTCVPGPHPDAAEGPGGPSGAVVVQRATPVPVLLLCLGDPHPGAGSRRRGAPFHHHQLVWGVAPRGGHHVMPPGPDCSAQAAPQLCYPGHELRAQPASDRPAKEWREGGPGADHGCGAGGDALWDRASGPGNGRPAELRHRGDVCIQRGADGSWCRHGSGRPDLWRPGLSEKKKGAEEEEEAHQSEDAGEPSCVQRFRRTREPEQQRHDVQQDQPNMSDQHHI